jgi:hypothetical protein
MHGACKDANKLENYFVPKSPEEASAPAAAGRAGPISRAISGSMATAPAGAAASADENYFGRGIPKSPVEASAPVAGGRLGPISRAISRYVAPTLAGVAASADELVTPPVLLWNKDPSFPTHVLKPEHTAYITEALDSVYEHISREVCSYGEKQRALAAISHLQTAFLRKIPDPTIPLNLDPGQLMGRDYMRPHTSQGKQLLNKANESFGYALCKVTRTNLSTQLAKKTFNAANIPLHQNYCFLPNHIWSVQQCCMHNTNATILETQRKGTIVWSPQVP